MAMLYYWTRECEAGITELRYERRAIQNTKARFQANIAKIPTALARNCFRNLEETMLPLHRLRLENLYTVCLKVFENCSGILFFLCLVSFVMSGMSQMVTYIALLKIIWVCQLIDQ